MSQNTDTLLTVAADLRVVGYSWAQIADEVHRRPNTVQKWPARYKRDWDRIYKEAQRRRFEETNGECHLVLKQMLRSVSESTRLKAVGLWLKGGAAACGQTGESPPGPTPRRRTISLGSPPSCPKTPRPPGSGWPATGPETASRPSPTTTFSKPT